MDSYETNYNRFTKSRAISSKSETTCHKKNAIMACTIIFYMLLF